MFVGIKEQPKEQQPGTAVVQQQTNAVAPEQPTKAELIPSLRIMLDERLYEQVKRLSGIMSKDDVFTPKHLRGKAEACFSVLTQSLNWNLDPGFVAKATYQTPGGSIGFEGKLVQAILESSGRFIGAPKFVFCGDWRQVIGKYKIVSSDRGGTYAKRQWEPTDEVVKDLGVIVKWQVRGEAEPRAWPGEDDPFMLSQCWPLNSTLWATDPKTQITYLAMRRFANAVVPGIFGGAPFDHEDLIDASGHVIDLTPDAPARPTREEFVEQKPEEVKKEEPPKPTFEIVDGDGVVTTCDNALQAASLIVNAAEIAMKTVGRDGLEGVWESNGVTIGQVREADAKLAGELDAFFQKHERGYQVEALKKEETQSPLISKKTEDWAKRVQWIIEMGKALRNGDRKEFFQSVARDIEYIAKNLPEELKTIKLEVYGHE